MCFCGEGERSELVQKGDTRVERRAKLVVDMQQLTDGASGNFEIADNNTFGKNTNMSICK